MLFLFHVHNRYETHFIYILKLNILLVFVFFFSVCSVLLLFDRFSCSYIACKSFQYHHHRDTLSTILNLMPFEQMISLLVNKFSYNCSFFNVFF